MLVSMSDFEPVPMPAGDAARWSLTPLGRAELDVPSLPDVDEAELPVDESL